MSQDPQSSPPPQSSQPYGQSPPSGEQSSEPGQAPPPYGPYPPPGQGQAPPPYGYPPYGYPPYGYPPNPVLLPNAPSAVTSLVCGIIGVAIGCTGLIMGPIAIMQSKKAKDLIAGYPMQYGGLGMATAGYVLGIIGTILGAIAVLVIVLECVVWGTLFNAFSHSAFH